eukprot:1143054-Pelagomonas_calceolata.AAC.2
MTEGTIPMVVPWTVALSVQILEVYTFRRSNPIVTIVTIYVLHALLLHKVLDMQSHALFSSPSLDHPCNHVPGKILAPPVSCTDVAPLE